MDLSDEEELRILADECLEEIAKEAAWYDDLSDWAHKAVNSIGGSNAEKAVNDVGGIGEGALAGAATGALIGAVVTSWGGPLSLAGASAGGLIGGAIGGIVAAIGNTSPKVKNIKENAKDLLDQMNDLKKSVPEEAAFFSEVESTMAKLTDSSSRYLAAMDVLRSHYVSGSKEESPSETKAVFDATADFKKSIDQVSRLRNEFNRKNQVGAFANAKSSIPHFGLVADDIEDVDQSFQSLQVAIDDLNKQMTGVANKTSDKVQEAKAETSKTVSDPEKDKKYEDFKNLLKNPGEATKGWQGLFGPSTAPTGT
ncbi:unnamed protein product [Sphagnum jensenii]